MKQRYRVAVIVLAAVLCGGCAAGSDSTDQHLQSSNKVEQVLQEQTSLSKAEAESDAEQEAAQEETGTASQEATPDAAMQDGAIDLEPLPESDVDVDLTKMNATMIYARVLNLMMNPETYVGMTVRMSGKLSRYVDPETEAQYFACIIPDATACCTQGIEFVRKGDYRFPDDYPELDTEVVVEGVLEIYEENGLKYIHLTDADMRTTDTPEASNG